MRTAQSEAGACRRWYSSERMCLQQLPQNVLICHIAARLRSSTSAPRSRQIWLPPGRQHSNGGAAALQIGRLFAPCAAPSQPPTPARQSWRPVRRCSARLGCCALRQAWAGALCPRRDCQRCRRGAAEVPCAAERTRGTTTLTTTPISTARNTHTAAARTATPTSPTPTPTAAATITAAQTPPTPRTGCCRRRLTPPASRRWRPGSSPA